MWAIQSNGGRRIQVNPCPIPPCYKELVRLNKMGYDGKAPFKLLFSKSALFHGFRVLPFNVAPLGAGYDLAQYVTPSKSTEV